MDIETSIKQKRTIRLFKQDKLPYKILEKCVDCARLSSSARNSQPLEYIIVDETEILKKVLPFIRFGGLISKDNLARNGAEPTALIVIIVKKGYEQYYKYDVGIAAQNITLVAYENKIGCCMHGAIDRDKIKEVLEVPEEYTIDLVISLGYPAEKPIFEETDNEPEYYRKEDVFYVQKRKLKKVLHKNKY